MSELEQKVEALEDCIKELQLDAHASRIAITVLSSAINSVSGKQGHLANIYEEGIKATGPTDFDHPVDDGYETKLNEKVIALLAKA
jgi:hypothetical protein